MVRAYIYSQQPSCMFILTRKLALRASYKKKYCLSATTKANYKVRVCANRKLRRCSIGCSSHDCSKAPHCPTCLSRVPVMVARRFRFALTISQPT